ncbi:putative primosomal protein N' [Mycobacterium intracellulare]|nr:putative primosomal protein N' [Mycobacterium intracellulare]
MLSVPHLDREFDYLVSAEQSDDAQPGVRVRVRFHGRLVDGFVLERRADTDHPGKLGWLDRVVSAEPVLTPEIRRLVDAVAARYAGTRPDVLRLAVPARHARVEREPAVSRDPPGPAIPDPVDPRAGTATGGALNSWPRWPSRGPPGPSGRRCRASRGPTDSPRPPRKRCGPAGPRWRSFPTSATWTPCGGRRRHGSTRAAWSPCRRAWAPRPGIAAGWRRCGAPRGW